MASLLRVRFLASNDTSSILPKSLISTPHGVSYKERNDQMDFFFKAPAKKLGDTFWYKHVFVVGEQKNAYDSIRHKNIQSGLLTAHYGALGIQSVWAIQLGGHSTFMTSRESVHALPLVMP